MSEQLKKILEEIDSGIRNNIYDLDLTVEELLTKDQDGKYFLEHLLEKKISLYSMIGKVKNNVEIACIFCKHNESIYSFEFDEKDLFSDVNGITFIEFILEHDKLTSNMVKAIKNRKEIIDIIVSSDKTHMLNYLSPEIIEKLMIKNEDGTYEIEKYLNFKNFAKNVVPLINDVNGLIDLCNKNNDYELMKYANENILMTKYKNDDSVLNYLINEKNIEPIVLNFMPSNIEFVKFLMENNLYSYLIKANEYVQVLEVSPGKTLIETLVEKGYTPEMNSIWNEETVKVLNKIKKLDLIKGISETLLLKPARELLGDIDNISNETFLEYMLDNGYNPFLKAFHINNDEILKVLYKRQRYDLISKISKDKLFNFVDESKTYFEYIIENIKEGKLKKRVADLKPYGDSIGPIVKYYLTIAKYDMIEFINRLDEEDLLKKYGEKTLLEGLLEADSNLTLNKVIKEKEKSKPKIAAILKSKGFIQQNADVSLKNNDFTTDYLNQIQGSFGIGPFQNEGEFLLNKLQQLFLSDGKSDEGLVMALVSGYRQSLLVNYEVNIEEIKKLIEVKESNLDNFFYVKKEGSGYFSRLEKSVFCDNDVIDTILHETGHALHYYLTDNKIPANYEEIIEKAKRNPEILKKTEDISNKLDKLYEDISKLVENKYKSFFETYYSESKKEEIREILKKSKEEKKQEYASLNIPEEQLDVILEEMFTLEEYIEHQKRIFIRENTDAIIRSEFGGIMSICDILDAIYDGYLYSSNLENQNGDKIKSTVGHGISYYFETLHGFDEMVANFASLSKSKNSTEMLQLLKSTVGDEVYNMLSNFYYQNIVGIKEEQLETRKNIGGK